MRRIGLLTLALISTQLSSAAASVVVHNDELGFSFRVPDGFVDFPAGKMQPDFLYCYTLGYPNDGKPHTAITFQRLPWLIGHDDMSQYTKAHNNLDLLKEDWRGFQIDVIRSEQNVGTLKIITFAAQIPLTPKALQINVAGEASRESEVKQALTATLGTVEGKSNWELRGDRLMAPAERIQKIILGLVGTSLIIILTLIVWRRVFGKREPSHTESIP